MEATGETQKSQQLRVKGKAFPVHMEEHPTGNIQVKTSWFL